MHSRRDVRFAIPVIALTLFFPPLAAAEPSIPASMTDLGGLFLPAESGERVRPAPLVGTEIEVDVSGIVARTRVRQIFRNPTKDWTEAIYTFPLATDTAVDRLRMTINGRVVEGRIEEKATARRIYTQAKRSGRRASLVEQHRPNLFTTSLANLGPKETVTIEIVYQEVLPYRDGGFQLRLPLVVGPRYIPGRPLETGFHGTGWSAPTDQVGDAAQITPPVRGPKAGTGNSVGNPVTLRVNLDAGFKLAAVTSSTHGIAVSKDGQTRATVTLAGDAVPANKDFILAWKPVAGAAPQAGLFTEIWQGKRYALMMLMPPVIGHDGKAQPGRAPSRRQPREVVFIIDKSGSMHGPSMHQAKQAIRLALDRLTPLDSFQMVAFSDTHTAFAPAPVSAGPSNITRARAFVDNLDANGGTEIVAAVAAALKTPAMKNRLRQVMLITDGAVGNETELFDLISRDLGASRLFTVGIGSAPNGYLMTRAARAGRGTYTFIPNTSEVAAKMGALFKRLENPALTDISITWPKGSTVSQWPDPVPDLYMGEPIVAVAELNGPANRVNISGRFDNALWMTTAKLAGGRSHSGVAALWARARIRNLMGNYRRAQDRDRVRAEIVATALKHKLVSRFTSLVAVDKTPARPASKPLAQRPIPTNMPEGWSHKAVFGKAPMRSFRPDMPLLKKARAALPGQQSLAVPQTATSARLLMVLGLIALALALAFGAFWGRSRYTDAMNKDLRMREHEPVGPAGPA